MAPFGAEVLSELGDARDEYLGPAPSWFHLPRTRRHSFLLLERKNSGGFVLLTQYSVPILSTLTQYFWPLNVCVCVCGGVPTSHDSPTPAGCQVIETFIYF